MFGLARQAHLGEDIDAPAERRRVHVSIIAAQPAGPLQRPHPAQTRRRRQADAAGQVNVGQAAITLQMAQNGEVCGIEIGQEAIPFLSCGSLCAQ